VFATICPLPELIVKVTRMIEAFFAMVVTGGSGAPNSAIVIQAGQNASNEQVSLFLEVAREANMENVSISTEV